MRTGRLMMWLLTGLLPFFAAFGYLKLHINKGLKETAIRQLLHQQSELRKRNMALKKEVDRFAKDDLWTNREQGATMLEHNRIIHLDLPDVPGQKERLAVQSHEDD